MNALLLAIATMLTNHTPHEATLTPGSAHTYELRLRRGESADVVVRQKGVDVIVELRAPNGRVLDEIDGPTGRMGDEHVEIIANERGAYRLTVRPFDANEPSGTYAIELQTVRSVDATSALLAVRHAARDRAADWLRTRSAPLTAPTTFDELAKRTRVIALGEATHGSREFGDARLALTRRLIEQHGYRVVAVEASTTRLASSELPASWIGRRTLRELMEWLHVWNAAHPTDRVQLIGVDPQDGALARTELRAFLQQAYGDAIMPRWTAAEKELAAADEQSAVFGDSSVSAETRQTLFDLVARLTLDVAMLRARHGVATDRALAHARGLAAFADYNSGAAGGKSRDWYMADGVLRAIEGGGRAVFWAHNAHVTTRGQYSGALLRSALGCDYAAIALTFGEGAFVAQVPNDIDDRLLVSTLPPASNETFENVFASFAKARIIATWPCKVDAKSLPEWLRTAHPLHWVGGIWAPASLASAAYRPYDLVHDFDGLLYFPRVTADEQSADRPRVAPRVR
jgi:erythromycin esterase-like protein